MDPEMLAMILGGAGSLLQGMGKGSPGSSGYDVVNFNDPNDQYQRQASAAYMMDQLNSLRAGQAPDWLNRFAGQQEDYLLKQNRNQMFGKEGAAGGSLADVALSTGAMTGLGGQAAQAPVNKALSDYADRMSGINQYIASLKNNYMTTASQQVPQQLSVMSQQKNQIVPISHPGSSADPMMQGIGGALSGVDWSKLLGRGNTAGSQVVPQQSFNLPYAVASAVGGQYNG